MTDSLMPIAVSVLFVGCVYLFVCWWSEWVLRKNFASLVQRKQEQEKEWGRWINELQEEIVELHRATSYYADKANWQSEAGKHSAAYKDKGAIARKALQGDV